MKAKLIIAIIVILAIAIAAAYLLFFMPTQLPQNCSKSYTVHCNAKSIPCASNNDCSVSSMTSFCPEGPNLLKCINAKYYCGTDGFCKGCDCTVPI